MTTDPRALIVAGASILLIGVTGWVFVLVTDTPATDAGRNAARTSTQPGTPVRPVEEAPPLAEKITRDGVVVVGKHVKRGTYRTAGGPRCTWARLIDLTGDATSILDRGTAPGRTDVDLVTGVIGFETNGCPEWVMVR